MGRLFFASLVTLGLLLGMVVGVILAAMVALEQVDLTVAIVLTVVFNLLLWVISPWLTDLSLRWLNSMRFLEDGELARQYPYLHKLVHDIARKHGFKPPHIGIIADRNPTAFTYGWLRSNARIVLTEGTFEFLNEDEVKAVTAHELGHIVHRDFILMTMAGILVQVLYQVYAYLSRSARRSSGSDDKGKGAVVAISIAALIGYYLGTYLLLYLSRTREYLADSFSAKHVEPRHLASALVKIAYGITEAKDTDETSTLLRSTRHLGIMDVKHVRELSLIMESTKQDTAKASEAMLFDVYNPWGKLVEIGSTHPLTGRRIAHLADIARENGQPFPDYNIEAAAKRTGLDPGKLWNGFLRDILIYAAPILAALAAVVTGSPGLAPAAAAVAVLATLRLRYPAGAPARTTVAALMANPAASPVIGRHVQLEGQAIGRASPGYVLGEDVIYQDRTGLMMVDFRSMLGGLGDWITGYFRTPGHLEQPGHVVGWFRRSMGGYLILRKLTSTKGTLNARPYFWQVLLSLIVIGATLAAIFAFGFEPVRQPVLWRE